MEMSGGDFEKPEDMIQWMINSSRNGGKDVIFQVYHQVVSASNLG